MADKQSPQGAGNKSSLADTASLMTARWTQNADYTTSWMGPLNPLPSVVPSGQARSVAGRMLDYAPGFNMRTRPRGEESVSFQQMRALADSCDILRLVIETRKDEMAKLVLSIVPREEDKEPDSRCKDVETFLRRPDGENSWSEWLRQLLEEMLVTDAACIYPLKTLSGNLLALELLDGTTIKRVIDERGRTPRSPDPAYQQILKGVPTSLYTTEELIYRPRNKRVHKIYGYSPVEQIINTVNIAVRRALHQLQYYTEGSTPDLLFQVPPDWNLQQIKDFNDWWNDMLSGKTGLRRKAQFVPNGVTPLNTKEAILKDPYDEWLARVICYAFSVSPQWAVREMNRATAETAVGQAKQEGLYPVMNWVLELIDYVLEFHFGWPDLKSAWSEEKSAVGPADQAKIDDTNLKNGSKLLNEVRASRGDGPVEGGDKPMVLTATGYVPVVPEEPEEPAAGEPVVVPGQKGAQAQGQDAPDAAGDSETAAAGASEDDDEQPEQPAGGQKGKAEKARSRWKLRKAKSGSKVTKLVTPINRERPEVVAARSALAKAVGKLLKKQLKVVLADLVAKADGSSDDDFADSFYRTLSKHLADIASEGVDAAAAQIDAADESVTDLANENAVAWAKSRAADMVGKKLGDDGELVDNPDADYSVVDSTRELIRSDVSQAMEEGWSNDDLAAKLAENYAFSDTRAEAIARTETAKADVQGNLELYLASGQVSSKQWITGDGCCDECQELNNMVVGLDEDFDGNPDPPLHPNCRCDVLPILADDPSDS